MYCLLTVASYCSVPTSDRNKSYRRHLVSVHLTKFSITDKMQSPGGVRYGQVSFYTLHNAVPAVSAIDRFHFIHYIEKTIGSIVSIVF